MNDFIALYSFGALAAVVTISCISRINVGLLSLGVAWLVGHFVFGMPVEKIIRGFPLSMFLVLFGVTYFFNFAKSNGTLQKVTHFALKSLRVQPVFIPIVFFFLALILSTLGTGNIGAVALLAPLAMPLASSTGLGAFLMSVMIVGGANAGTFSPFALTGIIANGLVVDLGLNMKPWSEIYLPNLFVQSLVAFLVFAAFYIYKRRPSRAVHPEDTGLTSQTLTGSQKITLLSIFIFVFGAIVFSLDIGFLAITLAGVLTLLKVADGQEALKTVPWNAIWMVCGVSTLISIIESTGGLDFFVDVLARIAHPDTVTGLIALITGIVSSFSSSSGVVVPTFIPIVPDLIEKIGGGSPTEIITSINVGSHIVDVSPLSTLGALCLASAAAHEDKEKLFRHLLIYSFVMAFVGAVACYIFFKIF